MENERGSRGLNSMETWISAAYSAISRIESVDSGPSVAIIYLKRIIEAVKGKPNAYAGTPERSYCVYRFLPQGYRLGSVRGPAEFAIIEIVAVSDRAAATYFPFFTEYRSYRRNRQFLKMFRIIQFQVGDAGEWPKSSLNAAPSRILSS